MPQSVPGAPWGDSLSCTEPGCADQNGRDRRRNVSAEEYQQQVIRAFAQQQEEVARVEVTRSSLGLYNQIGLRRSSAPLKWARRRINNNTEVQSAQKQHLLFEQRQVHPIHQTAANRNGSRSCSSEYQEQRGKEPNSMPRVSRSINRPAAHQRCSRRPSNSIESAVIAIVNRSPGSGMALVYR